MGDLQPAAAAAAAAVVVMVDGEDHVYDQVDEVARALRKKEMSDQETEKKEDRTEEEKTEEKEKEQEGGQKEEGSELKLKQNEAYGTGGKTQ